MGRPPLRRDAKVRKRTIWMHDDQVARVIERVGSQGLSNFVREAVDAKLEGEEGDGAGPGSPVPLEGSADDFGFFDDEPG